MNNKVLGEANIFFDPRSSLRKAITSNMVVVVVY
jgi:hypothetical protein